MKELLLKFQLQEIWNPELVLSFQSLAKTSKVLIRMQCNVEKMRFLESLSSNVKILTFMENQSSNPPLSYQGNQDYMTHFLSIISWITLDETMSVTKY